MLEASYQPGLRIGAYTVVEEIARGGQGVVLKVRTPNGSLAALKLLSGGDERDARRFLQEGRLLAKLSYPSLPRVHDSGSVGLTPYLCMDYVEGTDLQRFLKDTGVPPVAWTVQVLCDVAETVHYLHERGVIHRDLKPPNVILEAGTQRPVLVDFGIVKRDTRELTLASLDGLSLSKTGEIYGTPAFMAPEQIEGVANETADVYGLGATLYALLTGVPPFQGTSAIHVLTAVQADPPVDPRHHNPQVPAGLARFCLRCLDKDPARRPQSAQAFAEGLRAQGQPRAARRWVVAGAALAALLGVGLALSQATPTGEDPATDEAEPPAADTAALFKQANALLELDPAGAAAVYAQILRETPDNARAYYLRGEALKAQGLHAEAIADFSRALELGEQTPQLLLSRAYSFEQLGEHERALEGYTQAIDSQAGFADAHLLRGVLYEALGNEALALADYSAALTANPKEFAAWYNRARIYTRGKSYSAALADYTRAVELAPDWHEGYAGRGEVHMRMKNFPAALADLSTAIELRPTSANLYHLRAVAHGGSGNLKAAIHDYELMLALDETSVAGFLGRGALRGQLGEPAAALDDLNAAIRLDPTCYEAYLNRASANAELGRLAEQIADLERFAELTPNRQRAEQARKTVLKLQQRLERQNDLPPSSPVDPYDLALFEEAKAVFATRPAKTVELCTQILRRSPEAARANRLRADALRVMRRYKEAIADYTRALELGDPAPGVIQSRALCFYSLGLFERALKDLTDVIELDPQGSNAYIARGAVHEALGDPRLALADYATALGQNPNDTAVLHNRAGLHFQQGDLSAALADYTRALELDSTKEVFYMGRSEVYRAQGRHDLVVEDLNQALKLKPDWPQIHHARAAAYLELGNLEAAERDYTRALELDPRSVSSYLGRSTVYGQRGELESALGDLNAALELEPARYETYLNRSMVFQDLERPAEQLADLERFVDLAPDDKVPEKVHRAIRNLKQRLADR